MEVDEIFITTGCFLLECCLLSVFLLFELLTL